MRYRNVDSLVLSRIKVNDLMAEQLIADRSWAEIPYFRKTWFTALLFFIFMPAYLLMIWTGDVYYRKRGVVYRISSARRTAMTCLVALLMLPSLVGHFF
jgi:hypothetical protein